MAYILRAQNIGKKSMPHLGELLGIKVFTSEDSLPEDDYAFRWGCTSRNLGATKVINKVPAMEETTDKSKFRKKLADAGLAPFTYLSFESWVDDWVINNGESELVMRPVIVRPEFHERSKNLHLCTKPSEVYKAWKTVGKGYISEYIKKTQEFRVFVVSGRIAWMIEKHPKSEDEVSWGCVSDGEFDYVDWSSWPKHVSECALKSMALTDLDFGAIDIIVKDSVAYTMEINTAPYLTPYYTKCVAKCFKHIIQNGRDHFPAVTDYSWQNVIHPAIQKAL
jgi:glutathione synthase/RimK-type ligase-like ATP-grasp enzyme